MKKSKIVARVSLAMIGNIALPIYATMPDATVVLGNKAFELEYAERLENRKEILDAINASQDKIYLKLGNKWLTNEKQSVDTSLIPKVIYKNKDGQTMEYKNSDGDEVKEEILNVEEFKAISSKEIRVIFNKPVENKELLGLRIKLNNIETRFVEKRWNDSSTEVVLKAPYNLKTGEYLLSVNIDGEKKEYKNKIEEAKLSVIEVAGQYAYIIPGTNYQKIKIKIIPKNQYGEEWSEIGSNFKVMVSPASAQKTIVDSKNGIITATYTGGYREDDTVVLNINEFKSGISVSKTLKVQQSAKVKSISIGDVMTTNSNYNNEPLYKSNFTKAEYYLPIEVVDESGRILTKEEIEGQVMAFPNNNLTPLYIEFDKNNEPRIYTVGDKTALKIKPGVNIFAGEFTFNVYSKENNIKSEKKVSILEDHIINQFELQYPEEEVYQGKEVIIPFRAVSNYGRVLSTAAELQLKYQQQENTWLTNVEFIDNTRISTDGAIEIMVTTDYKTNQRILKLRVINKYAIKGNINVFTTTSQSSSLSVDIMEAAEPRDIHEISSDLLKFVENDMSIVQTIYDQKNGINTIDIRDQYGKEIALLEGYRVSVLSDNNNESIGLIGNKPITEDQGNVSMEYGNPVGYIIDGSIGNFIKVQPTGKEGIEHLVVRLEKLQNGKWDIVDEEVIKIESVNQQYIENYNVKLSGPDKLYTGANRIGNLYTEDETAITYEVIGFYYGNEVKLRQDGKVIAGITGGLDARIPGKVKPNVVETNSKEQKAVLTVVYQGASGMQTLTRDIPYSSETPKTIDIKLLDKNDNQLGDTVTIGRSNLLRGVEVTSRNEVWFRIKDQYGITMPKYCSITVGSQLSGDGRTEKKFVTVNDTEIKIDNTAQTGDSFNVILLTNDGVIKTLKVIVGN